MLTFFKKYKFTIIIAAAVVAALVVAFFMGGSVEDVKNSPKANPTAATYNSTPTEQKIAEATETTTVALSKEKTQSATEKQEVTTAPTQKATEKDNSKKETSASNTEIQETKPTDKYRTEPIPSGKPKPVEPQEQTTDNTRITCTFSISCATILDNMYKLDKEKVELVPEDGWIFKPTEIEFYEGESVYDILVRVCKDNKIHMESSFTPMYNSVYLEGISNLYEFDCGGNSGWKYCVNDWFPNYGCSRYVVQKGDIVEFKYTCNLGYDIGSGLVEQW